MSAPKSPPGSEQAVRAGAAGATGKKGAQAAREAAGVALGRGGFERADFALVFATEPLAGEADEILSALRHALGTARIAGCFGRGVISDDGEVEGRPAIAVLAVAGAEGRPFLVGGARESPAEAGEKLAALLTGCGAGAAVVLTDPTVPPRPFLEALFRGAPGVAVAGGVSAGPATRKTVGPQLVVGTEVATGAVAALALPPPVRPDVVLCPGARAIGTRKLATKVLGNLICEIDGRPATEVLGEALRAEAPAGGPRILFAGVETGTGDCLISRPVAGIDVRSGAVAILGEVAPGQAVQFQIFSPDSARDQARKALEQAVLARQRREGGDVPEGAPVRNGGVAPRFGVVADCLGRGQGLYGEPDVDLKAIRASVGPFPLAGFFGNGEIATSGGPPSLHAYTGVLLLCDV